MLQLERGTWNAELLDIYYIYIKIQKKYIYINLIQVLYKSYFANCLLI